MSNENYYHGDQYVKKMDNWHISNTKGKYSNIVHVISSKNSYLSEPGYC